MLNAAVIGVGSMGKNHVRIYNDIDDVKLIAISDINKENQKIAEIKERIGEAGSDVLNYSEEAKQIIKDGIT